MTRSEVVGPTHPQTMPTRAILSHVVSTDDSERKKDEAWANLCRAEGWVCRVCGSVPERGQRFTDNLCDDCRKIVRNE
jgi:hypothetical protein